MIIPLVFCKGASLIKTSQNRSTMIFEIFLFFLMVRVDASEKGIIFTTTGPIKGKLVYEFGVQYNSYEGIPYAESPTGELRFKPPVPKAPWTEILDASKQRYVCPQAEGPYTKEQMNEDCLFLNVYVPANDTDHTPRPVLFYIPGGEFNALSGYADYLYGPQLLMHANIIVATVNYRLGALGFLSLDVEEASGNAGLKDILLALKWINANVEKFGGDRNKITVGGNSAGAVSTHYFLLSTKSVGLFNQAILLSGSALGYRFLSRHAKQNALALCKQLNITGDTTSELLQKLKEVAPFDIIQAVKDLGENDTRGGFRPFAPFVPCIEIEYPDAFIAEDPRAIIKSGIPNNVPILVGFNNADGLKMYPAIRKDSKLVDYLNEDFEQCIPSDIEYPYGSKESKELAKSIRQFYFNGANISCESIENFVDLITDTMFSYSIDSWIDLQKQKEDGSKVYFYVFGFDGQLNWFKLKNDVHLPRAAHADEEGYIFVTNVTRSILNNLDDRSQRSANIMISALSDFVKFGNPSPQNNNIGIVWNERGEERSFLYIDDHVVNIEGGPIPSRLQFWQEAYGQYYAYLENGGRIERKIVP